MIAATKMRTGEMLSAAVPDQVDSITPQTPTTILDVPESSREITPETPVAALWKWYRSEYLPAGAEETLTKYERSLRRFDESLHRPAVVADLTPEKIAAAMESLAKVYAPRTIRAIQACLMTLATRQKPKRRRFKPSGSIAPIIVAPTTGTPDLPLRPLFEAFKAKKLPFAAAQTEYQYELNIFTRFAEFCGHEPTTLDLSDENIAACMAWMVRRKKLSPTSANKLRDNFNAFWGFLARQRIMPVFPEIAEMTEPEKIPVAWTRNQLHQLWMALERQPGDWEGIPIKLWWMSLHSVMWDTASRLGAIRQVRWQDIDLDDRWVTLRPETTKGQRRGQVIRLHEQTVALLRRIVEPRRELVWPWPYRSQDYIYTLYREILKGAGLPTGPDRAFHCMRKSSISWFAAAGGDATKLAGHATAAMTERHYIDPKIVGSVSASGTLFRMFERPEATRAVTESPPPEPVDQFEELAFL